MGLLLRREVCINLCGFDVTNTEMGIDSMHKDEISQRSQHTDWEQNSSKQWRRNQPRLRKRGVFQWQKRAVLLKLRWERVSKASEC